MRRLSTVVTLGSVFALVDRVEWDLERVAQP